jgi:hypothetical protein
MLGVAVHVMDVYCLISRIIFFFAGFDCVVC